MPDHTRQWPAADSVVKSLTQCGAHCEPRQASKCLCSYSLCCIHVNCRQGNEAGTAEFLLNQQVRCLVNPGHTGPACIHVTVIDATVLINLSPHPSPQAAPLLLRIDTLKGHNDMLANQAGRATVSYNNTIALLKQEVATCHAEKQAATQQHKAALAASSVLSAGLTAEVSQLKVQVEGLLRQCKGVCQ